MGRDGQLDIARKYCSHQERPIFWVNQHNLNRSLETICWEWMKMWCGHWGWRRRKLGTWHGVLECWGYFPALKELLGKGYMKDCGTSHSCGGPWGSLARGDPTNPMDIWASQGIIQRVGRDRTSAVPASPAIGTNPPGAPHLPPRSSSFSSLLGQERVEPASQWD